MKKTLMLSLALLTIGSALHAGKGAAFGGGFATGLVTGAVINNASNRRDREVVYVKDSSDKDLKRRVEKLEKENEKLKKEKRRKRGS